MKHTMDWGTRERLWRMRALLTLALEEMSDIQQHNTTGSTEEMDALSDAIDNLAVARDEMGEIVAEPKGSLLTERGR